MSLLQVKNLDKGFNGRTIFSKVSFNLEKGQKVALVGFNGTGKTTLLKIIAGIESADAGSIKVAKETTVGYLPQDQSIHNDVRVGSFLKDDFATKAVMAGLGIEALGLDRKMGSLSGGQKTKVLLANILLADYDVLLLDEPTNNLDLPALLWLEDYLVQVDTACVIVSHDRRFLDKVVSSIIEIDWSTREITEISGSYSDYVNLKRSKIENDKKRYEVEHAHVESLKRSVEDMKDVSMAKRSEANLTDNDKFRAGFKADRMVRQARHAKAIETRIENLYTLEKPAEREPLFIPIEHSKSGGDRDIRIMDATAGYGAGSAQGFSIGPLSLYIKEGERIGIIGYNGSGKSTLVKMIAKALPIESGELFVGKDVHFANLIQDQAGLPLNTNVVTFFMERTGLDDEHVFSTLTKYGFVPDQLRKPLSNLSPGETIRMLLAAFSVLSINTLILDEPTNHLDIEALAALEETLATYKGTVILVSHDRYLMEHAKLDQIYLMEDGKLSKLPSLDNYIENAEMVARKTLRLVGGK